MLVATVPLAMWFEFGRAHSYVFAGTEHRVGPEFLVNVPANLFSAITFPDFGGVLTATGLKYIVLFSIIGSLESLLSAKAVEQIDPWRRKTNHDRDLLAVGVGNTAAALVGGLPMISEIVRSKANIDNGARTRFANLFHGVFLLLFVALVPSLINQIPLAALAAMLVFTGFRLASPPSFAHMYHVGREQLVVFVATIVGVLATDLLVGIFIGIAVKALIHVLRGVPPLSLLRLKAREQRSGGEVTLVVNDSAVFSTWLALRSRLQALKGEPRVVFDLVRHDAGRSHRDGQAARDRERVSRGRIGAGHHRPRTAPAAVGLSNRGAAGAAARGGRMTRDPASKVSAGPRPDAASTHDADAVRQLIHEACEPVAQFWPMKRFVHHNPIHGLEHLPFDQAVRRAKRLLGGNGYLPNSEYRGLYRTGRIAADSVAAALQRLGPPLPDVASVPAGDRHLQAEEVWRAQLLFGFDPLEPLLVQWTLGPGGGRRHFQADSRRRRAGASWGAVARRAAETRKRRI